MKEKRPRARRGHHSPTSRSIPLPLLREVRPSAWPRFGFPAWHGGPLLDDAGRQHTGPVRCSGASFDASQPHPGSRRPPRPVDPHPPLAIVELADHSRHVVRAADVFVDPDQLPWRPVTPEDPAGDWDVSLWELAGNRAGRLVANAVTNSRSVDGALLLRGEPIERVVAELLAARREVRRWLPELPLLPAERRAG